MLRPIRSVEEFYAHALAIEHEARERYAEFEGWFRERGEEVLAGLCRNLAQAEGAHFKELEKACRHLELPVIDASDYQWIDAGSPESPRREALRRVARPRQLLHLALAAERNAAAFFEWVAGTSPDARVRELAHELAAEEEHHVRWVRDAMQYHPE
jgi:rubrerythrin